MNSILKSAIVASFFVVGAGSAHAALSNNGIGENGQFQNGQFQNGQFSNGQFQNGQFQNGTRTGAGVDRTVVIHAITLSDGTVLAVE
ncbi:MAG: hypothetical protein J0H54_07030 [Rhizobiales bacterium]|nr:hypothetical protein [Hyphomicrobiales bacterium]